MPGRRDDRGHANLGFSAAWFDLGVITDEQADLIVENYQRSDDKNTEHYRYGAFHAYLASHRPLSASVAESLYRLGESDPNAAMGGAIMADIVRLPECPEALLAAAESSERLFLRKVVARSRLLAQLDAGLNATLFERCMVSGDTVVQRCVVESQDLTPDQLQRLATSGANRAIRNLATVRVRRIRRG